MFVHVHVYVYACIHTYMYTYIRVACRWVAHGIEIFPLAPIHITTLPRVEWCVCWPPSYRYHFRFMFEEFANIFARQ